MAGYTKEKADKLIDQHETEAGRLDREADEAEEYETFDKRHSEDLRNQAQKERNMADNQRELKKHWDD